MRYHETAIQVRFNEIDAYNVAWHGHYVAWLEVGRNALAGEFGLDVTSIAESGYMAPVVSLDLKYLLPARLGETLLIRTSLRKGPAANLEFCSTIVGQDGTVRARGATVHVLIDSDGILQYRIPQVIAERVERMLAWQEDR